MKTPFQLIDEIRRKKERYLLEPDDAFSFVVIQKGLSMQSPEVCNLLSKTTNRLHGELEDQQYIDIWKLLIPKSYKYFTWISKKDKNKKQKDQEISQKIKRVSSILEKSPKDIIAIMDINPGFLDLFEEEKIIIKQKKN